MIGISINSRKEVKLLHNDNDKLLELDLWIPELNLSFEFQVFHNIIILK